MSKLSKSRKDEFVTEIRENCKAIDGALKEKVYGDVEMVLQKAHNLSILTANSAMVCGKAKALLMYSKHERLEELKGMNLMATILKEDINSYCWEEAILVEYTVQLAKNVRAAIDLLRTDISKYKEELNSSVVTDQVVYHKVQNE